MREPPSHHPPPPPRLNPSRRIPRVPDPKTPIPNYLSIVRPVMSDSNPRKSSRERCLDQDLLDVRIGLDLFLNGQMNESEQLLNRRDTMYFRHGQAMILAVKAASSFNGELIEKAMKGFEIAIKEADKLRKNSGGLGAVKAVGSWVKGSSGGNSFKNMTRVQKHAELVYAESTALRCLFSVLYHQDLWAILDESFSLRTAYTIVNGLKNHFDMIEQELKAGKDISEYYIDKHLVTGVVLMYSVFTIMTSFLPESMMKLLQMVGFSTDREWALGLLHTTGNWDPRALGPESREQLQERLSNSVNDGIRQPLCDLVPIGIHLIVSSFLPFKHVDYAFAEQINHYNLQKYPNSIIFNFLKARSAQVNTQLDLAIQVYEEIKIQPEWRNLSHIGCFEQLMCAMMESNHDLACQKSRLLLRESNWSKSIYRYLAAVTTDRRGWVKEKPKVIELMGKVEPGMQKICGLELFVESYCARKANRFLKENHRLMLADYDFLVLWNGFDMMPLSSLEKALRTINTEVVRLEAILPPSMVAISNDLLPKNDFTIEDTKRVLSGIRSKIHSLSKKDKVIGYEMYYDDYCIAHYLLGLVSMHIAFFPNEVYHPEMCQLAIHSFKTVFRYAPYIKDDTYPYYFSHYNMGLILMEQGLLDQAEVKFKYLLEISNPTILGFTSLVAGKGKNSLEMMVQAKAHSAMYQLIETRELIAMGILSGSLSGENGSSHRGGGGSSRRSDLTGTSFMSFPVVGSPGRASDSSYGSDRSKRSY